MLLYTSPLGLGCGRDKRRLQGEFDARMVTKDNQRKSRRHPARWKVAVVLDNPGGEPIVLHTHSVDLSLGGMAIVSERDEKTDTVVTVLLVQPLRQGGEDPKILKARARVVSSSPFDPGHRLGLRFIEWTDDSLELFAKLLGAFEAARSQEAAGAATAAAPAEATGPITYSRLNRLREQAQAKLSEKDGADSREGIDERVSEALKRAYEYLKELADQLNVVKPAFQGYPILGVPDFSGLVWEKGRADCRKRDLSPTKWLYERVTLGFQLSGKKQIRVTFDGLRSNRMKQVLTENKIEFTQQETRNDRGAVDRVTFAFPCDVTAGVLLEGNFETGRILLRLSNVGHFGVLEHRLAPEAVTEEALEEFAGFILGENHRIDLLLRKDG